tara:strand:- start:4553 stop:5596 length:1044 start_codon:yes stop_codon:yes gene_type:complete
MGIKAYYNEFDPKAAAWLRQLIKDKLITDGEVDDRSIEEVTAADVAGFDRVHWFAGIGTWDYCLNQSGWGDRNVWTASLPCQPFSSAGKQLGKKDERHLLPHFLEIVRECRPDVIIGEQVASAIKHGWLDDLYTEMEREDYTVGSCVFTAAGVGQAHIRPRLYWVANTNSERIGGEHRESDSEAGKDAPQWRQQNGQSVPTTTRGAVSGMGDTEHNGRATSEKPTSTIQPSQKRGQEGQNIPSESTGTGRRESTTDVPGRIDRCPEGTDSIKWLYCRDNKYRPIEPGIKPLVDGTAEKLVRSCNPGDPIDADHTQEARVMRLKGYGNGIVVPCATAFISAYMDVSSA